MDKNPYYKPRVVKWQHALLLVALLSTASLFAQTDQATKAIAKNQKISGTVTDATGPLQGVNVTVQNTTTTTQTDASGAYTISALPTQTLTFSHIGHTTQNIPINGRSVINARLSEDATALKEVTVNAGYYSVKEKERTGSISKVKAGDIAKQPVSNPLAALQGRMPGVSVSQTTGVPGGGFEIQIRGRNSIRTEGNAPLYLVDGVPYNSDSAGSTLLSGALLPGGGLSPLNSINPNDIERIEVLKDADATSIYGSRGANGVVLITTKKGRAGKTRFGLNSYTGAGSLTRKMDLLDTETYLAVRRKAFANDNIATYPASAYDINGTWDQSRYTDWQQELVGGTALVNSIQAQLSGGNAQTRFLLSGTHYRETTVFPGDFAYRKLGFNSSLDHDSQDGRFFVGLQLNYVADKNDLLATDLYKTALRLAPNAPALYDAGGNLNWENSTWENPLRLLRETYLAKNNNLVASGTLGYKLLKGLEAKAVTGYTDSRLQEQKVSPSTVYNPALNYGADRSFLMLNNARQQSWSFEPQLSYQAQLGPGTLSALAGGTLQERIREQLGLYGGNFASNALITNLMAASQVLVLGSEKSKYRYSALFARVNYALRDKYFLNLTGRRDGSSRFGPGNRFAAFGAIGAAWVFGNEAWLKSKLPVLSFGKLRASYGTTGSDQIGDYQFMDTYGSSGVAYQGVIGLDPIRLYNPDFSWETNRKTEAAIDLGFLGDRIFTTVAHYRNRSQSQLVGIPLPATTGFSSISANLPATVQNTGWEVELRATPLRTPTFNWTLSVNLTLPKNELVEFPNLEGSTYASQYVVGQPLDIRQVYHYTGTHPVTGAYQFEDYNGDGQITSADRKKTVVVAPEYFGGLSNSLSYKSWQLDFLLQFVKQLGSNYALTAGIPGAFGNLPVEAIEADNLQPYTSGANSALVTAFSRYAGSDAAYSDASFVRLKNLSLGYTLPRIMKQASCRLYVQGQNLLTFTRYRGADPENQSNGYLPPLKMTTFGMQLNF